MLRTVLDWVLWILSLPFRLFRALASGIRLRFSSVFALSGLLALLFYFAPGFEPGTVGARLPEHVMIFYLGLFVVFWVYLAVQGYPIAHGNIGTSSEHHFDVMISGIPAITVMGAGLLHLVGFWTLSSLNQYICVATFLVAVYDLWVIGGAAAKQNRLTDELKPTR
ncbi:MAG: hypothetical protein WA021_00670 [Minisyncoccia bacterium]